MEVTFSPRGATITSVVLKKFQNQEQSGPLHLIQPLSSKVQSFQMFNLDLIKEMEKKEDEDAYTEDAAYKNALRDPLVTKNWKVEKSEDSVTFRLVFPKKKLTITKTYSFDPDKYGLNLEIGFQNHGEEKSTFDYRLNGAAGIAIERTFYFNLEGMIAKKLDSDALEITRESDSAYSNEKMVTREDVSNIHWVGISNKYFCGLLYPHREVGKTRYGAIGAFAMPRKEGQKEISYNLYSYLAPRQVLIPAGKEVTQNYTIYLGPKDSEVLANYKEPQFAEAVSYGWWIFAVFSKFFLSILHFFYNYVVANYGVAIILLTILVKGILFPLDYKAQKSMMLMQKIQPKVNKIRKKYKGKKGHESMQKMNKEMMALYQEHGVNPIGGCLPLFLQFPVFIGLYQAFNMDISLRQAGFVLWIQDLSMPDSLVQFAEPKSFFFMEFTGIHVLPMIMVVLMVLQQFLQPKTDDPQQQQQRKIFMFMMVFMGLIFYNFPSGLVLYFICQSLISVTEQKLILKHLKSQDIVPEK